MKANHNKQGLVDPDFDDDEDGDDTERARRMNARHFLSGTARQRIHRYKRKKTGTRRGR